jgi:hypothetical protein
LRWNLSAEDDHVEVSWVEAIGDVAEVVRRFRLVTETAEKAHRVVEDELALADQQYAPAAGH